MPQPAYRFDLVHFVCPRCDKPASHSKPHGAPVPRQRCAYCLMERVEIVELVPVKFVTAGQLAYEADRKARPRYPHGGPRVPWDRLDDNSRLSWERNPTPRWR